MRRKAQKRILVDGAEAKAELERKAEPHAGEPAFDPPAEVPEQKPPELSGIALAEQDRKETRDLLLSISHVASLATRNPAWELTADEADQATGGCVPCYRKYKGKLGAWQPEVLAAVTLFPLFMSHGRAAAEYRDKVEAFRKAQANGVQKPQSGGPPGEAGHGQDHQVGRAA